MTTSKMSTIKVLMLVFLVSLFLISNHMLDLCIWARKFDVGLTNRIWDIYNIALFQHIAWYIIYFCFFVVVGMYIKEVF